MDKAGSGEDTDNTGLGCTHVTRQSSPRGYEAVYVCVCLRVTDIGLHATIVPVQHLDVGPPNLPPVEKHARPQQKGEAIRDGLWWTHTHTHIPTGAQHPTWRQELSTARGSVSKQPWTA